ncbi:MFS transporter, partial [Klebsiella aerogenes]
AGLVVALVMRDRPEDVGLSAYGEPPGTPSPPPPSTDAIGTLRIAARSRVFWVLFGTFFVCGASTNGLIQT